MRWRTIGITAGAALAMGAVVVRLASAQAVPTYCCSAADGQCVASSGPCPTPTGSNVELTFSPSGGGVTMHVVTSEPPTGFVGACLVPFVTYTPQLPTICYQPGGNIVPGVGSTKVSMAAASAARSYGTLPASYDSYQALVTCYTHDADGTCPFDSFAVSRSCCDLGTNMISLDGVTATGTANFSAP
jgi:hypothetical protein